MAALNITDDTRRKALILHYGGERVFEIFETLDSNARVVTPATATTAAVNETCYEAARRALSDHFTPLVNTDFEMFTFRQSRQQDGESFEDSTHDYNDQQKIVVSPTKTEKSRHN